MSGLEPEHSKIITDDATPVEPGKFELEVSYSFINATRQWDNQWSGKDRRLRREHRIQWGATYGLIEDLDVGISLGFAHLLDRDNQPRNGSGLSDVSVGFKWRFLRDDDLRLSVAYLPGFTAPTGRKTNRDTLGPSQEFWSFDQKLALSKDWGPWTMNVDIGYFLPFGEKRRQARGTLVSNVAVGYQILDWLQPEVEINYSHDFIEEEPDSQLLAVTAGVILPFSDHWRGALGVQQAIAGRNFDRETTLSVSVTFIF